MTSSHISHKLAKGKNLWLYPYGLLIIVLLSILCFQLFDNANAKQSLTTTSHTPSLTQKAQPVADPGVTTQIFLPFVTQAVDNTSLTEEQPPQPIAASAVDTNYVGNSGIHPPIANNHTFVADTGGHLDQYLGRIDTANGRLTFPIAINGPVIEPLQVGSDGFPTAQAFVSLVDQQILPQYALLTLQVYDIDDELTLSCPQIDHIYVNGWQINDIKQGIPAVLRGGNEKWHIWTTIFPAYMLKYPTSPGINGQLPVAVSNEIAIAVDTACNPPHWKVEVDWVTISIESSRNYPLLFVHGWTGNVNTFSELAQFAEEQDIYTYTANLNFGIEPLPLSISLLKQEIEEVQTKYNADKVNLITHSRGGIFTRAALRAWPYLADSIQSYVTLSTPHHGVDAPESILSNDIAGPFDRCTPPGGPPPTGYQGDPDEYRNKCLVAAEGLR